MLLVIIPLMGTGYYLFGIAHDQYASTVGFSVRSEDTNGAQSLLGSLSSLSGASSSDTDILYEFIQSQTIVERVNKRIDLAAIYSLPAYDPIFAYDISGTIEDLVQYWQRMVKVSHASGAGLIELRVLAFRAEDSTRIAEIIVDEASIMINELSDIARADVIRHAQLDTEQALDRLKVARQNLTQFRSRTRIVDPLADLQGQQGLLNSLESQLAEAYINLNLLRETSNGDDPRIKQSTTRIGVIEDLIDQERQKFSTIGGNDSGKDYPTLVGDFENLSVEVEYTQQAYLAAQTMLDTAKAKAERQSRYLAIYAKPSLAQSARYPERPLLSSVISVFLLIIWSIGVLVYYSLRDRR
ncbi:MAG: sugar transporter [Rhodobacterales bacterium]